MEKIKSIKEINDYKEGYSVYSGYVITTNKQIITLLISNQQSCCENWGYFLSEDDVDEFIGAILKDVTLTDTVLNTKYLPDYMDEDGGIIFVNLETNKGTLQFTAYNSHNGYYGHEAKVKSIQLSHETCL
jgi:hypothetical protein